MLKLKDEVERIAYDEYLRATKVFGYIHKSDHEAYAVIKEELEESLYEIEKLKKEIKEFWESVKADKDETTKLTILLNTQKTAIAATAELTQVCAMIEKSIATINRRQEEEEPTVLLKTQKVKVNKVK